MADKNYPQYELLIFDGNKHQLEIRYHNQSKKKIWTLDGII